MLRKAFLPGAFSGPTGAGQAPVPEGGAGSAAPPRWLKGAWLLALLLSLYTVFGLPLFDEDEGEYAEVAVEMAHSGDYITPTLNGQAFYEKPVLAFWLQAPLVRVLGVHAGVFRLPSLLACVLWSLILLRFGKQQGDETTAWFAAFLCVTSLGVVVSAQAAAMDGVLSLLMSAACFDIYRYWLSGALWARRRVYLWMALGFLAKGPIAVVVPLAVSLIFFLSQKDLKRWLMALADPLGWLLFAAIALPWYLVQYRLMGQSFVDYFLFRENLGRLTGTLQGHGGSYGYYVPVLLLIVLPYTTLMLRAGFVSLRQHITPLTLFLWIWFAVVFGVFTLASTKLPHYLLIGLTPVFLLMARHREALCPPARAAPPTVALGQQAAPLGLKEIAPGPVLSTIALRDRPAAPLGLQEISPGQQVMTGDQNTPGVMPQPPQAIPPEGQGTPPPERQVAARALVLALLPWILMGLLTLALPAWVAQQAKHVGNPYLQELLQRGPEVFGSTYWGRATTIFGLSFGMMLYLRRRTPSAACWHWLVLAGLGSNALVSTCWLSAAAALQQQPVLEAARLTRTLAPGTPLVADNRMPSFAVYSGRPTQNRAPVVGDVVFLKADREPGLPPHDTLYAKGGIRLVRITAPQPDGIDPLRAGALP